MRSIMMRLFLAIARSASAVLWSQNYTEGVTPPLPKFRKLLKRLKNVLFAVDSKSQQYFR